MARIHPAGWQQLPAEGRLARQRATLGALADGLPDSYTVYHDVHWTRVLDANIAHPGHTSLFGQADFIVAGPGGKLLLIQQINGFLDETPDGLVHTYRKQRQVVAVQLLQQAAHLRARLTQQLGEGTPPLDILLYCPDHRVRQPGSAGLDPARLIDADQRDQLVPRIQALLREDDDAHATPADPRQHRFFVDELALVPEIGAIAGQAEALYTRLSGGLAHWARQIEMTPFRLRVTGTAGSGKTQLALAVLHDAVRAGRTPLYVCFNRPLADHVALLAPHGARVASYHQLCDQLLRAHGQHCDLQGAAAHRWQEAAFAALPLRDEDRVDELIIDEGQDFHANWRDSLLRLLRPDGRAWWLEDPQQNLYELPEVALPGWVRIRSESNYRSPADIVQHLNRHLHLAQPVQAGSPVTGASVELEVWDGPEQLHDKTLRAITRALGLGFRRDMIALVTFRGREHSALATQARLGPHHLRHFTGSYDLLQNPIYTDGDFLIDSVHRFKGQSAPCVIFTEIDFDTFDLRTQRKLFVGATRASMKLILVASTRAASHLQTDAMQAHI